MVTIPVTHFIFIENMPFKCLDRVDVGLISMVCLKAYTKAIANNTLLYNYILLFPL